MRHDVRDHLIHSYMGVPFDASETSPEVAALARRSLAGEKHPQPDLGVAFEEGRGVKRDLDESSQMHWVAVRGRGTVLVSA